MNPLKYGTLILFVFLQVQLHGQWWSLEGQLLGRSIGVTNNSPVDDGQLSWYQEIEGQDSLVTKNDLVLTEGSTLTEIRSFGGANLQLSYNWLLDQKVFFSCGLGIKALGYSAKIETAYLDYNWDIDTVQISSTSSPAESRPTIINSQGNITVVESNFNCDTIVPYYLGSNNSSADEVRFSLIQVSLPFSVNYNLIKNRLDLKAGLNLAASIRRKHSYSVSSIEQYENYPMLPESTNVCVHRILMPESETESPYLATFGLNTFLGLDLWLSHKWRFHIAMNKNVTSMNRDASTRADASFLNMPFKYRPLSFQLGFIYDLGKKKKGDGILDEEDSATQKD